MTTYTSKLSEISIPFIIPKRGKGSFEVIALCSIKGYGNYDGINYLSYLSPHARAICDTKLPVTIANSIKSTAKLDKLDFGIKFSYYIERSTPNYAQAYHELSCSYCVNCTNGDTAFGMGISVPIRIQQSGYIGLGELAIQINKPKYEFFEDILDDVQKSLGIKIYPINTREDSEAAKHVLDNGKSIDEYMDTINTCKAFKKNGNGGTAIISRNNIFKTHTIASQIFWQ